MPHYLLANYLPDDFDPSTVDEATVRAINDLNDELEASGARLMACGLAPASQAKSLRGQPNGEVLITDGPYLEAKEHIDVYKRQSHCCASRTLWRSHSLVGPGPFFVGPCTDRARNGRTAESATSGWRRR